MNNEPGSVPDYVYVTYIRASAAQVGRALTDADLTARYWGHANVSDWQPGSAWEHRRADGSGAVDVAGKVLAAEPPARLVITFEDSPDSEWNDRQILAHVSLISASTVAVVASVGSGALATYDNRMSQDPWTIERAIRQAGGSAGLESVSN